MDSTLQTATLSNTSTGLKISGSLYRGGRKKLFTDLMREIKRRASDNVTIDLEGIEEIDNIGCALLAEIARRANENGIRITYLNASERIETSLEKYSSDTPGITVGTKRYDAVWGIVDRFYDLRVAAGHLLVLVSDTLFWTVVALWNPKGHRRGSVEAQALAIGVGAMPIVLLIAFLIGVVLALQSASQLRQFGANIFVADLVCISMAREMGPLMTAIILAGRSGASIAAEISTMNVSEETDALITMGIKPVRYIVVPKILGITLTAPLLSVLATVFGIFGGFIVAVTALDLTPQSFWLQAVNALFLWDIVTGLIKSLVFAWLIVILAAYFGFGATGGPEGVGKATTKAVVASIFGVIVADSILGLLFYL